MEQVDFSLVDWSRAQFADWTQEGVNFVCRLKDNAKAQLQDVLFEKTLQKEEFGVYKVFGLQERQARVNTLPAIGAL